MSAEPLKLSLNKRLKSSHDMPLQAQMKVWDITPTHSRSRL